MCVYIYTHIAYKSKRQKDRQCAVLVFTNSPMASW